MRYSNISNMSQHLSKKKIQIPLLNLSQRTVQFNRAIKTENSNNFLIKYLEYSFRDIHDIGLRGFICILYALHYASYLHFIFKSAFALNKSGKRNNSFGVIISGCIFVFSQLNGLSININ